MVLPLHLHYSCKPLAPGQVFRFLHKEPSTLVQRHFLMYLRTTFYIANQHTITFTLGLDTPAQELAPPLEPYEIMLSAGAA